MTVTCSAEIELTGGHWPFSSKMANQNIKQGVCAVTCSRVALFAEGLLPAGGLSSWSAWLSAAPVLVPVSAPTAPSLASTTHTHTHTPNQDFKAGCEDT